MRRRILPIVERHAKRPRRFFSPCGLRRPTQCVIRSETHCCFAQPSGTTTMPTKATARGLFASPVFVATIRRAQRAQIAARIIKKAYGIERGRGHRVPIRFELLGDSVALAVIQDRRFAGLTLIKVARMLPDGRPQRMLKECRRGFASLKDQLRYFETLYRKYGSPQ